MRLNLLHQGLTVRQSTSAGRTHILPLNAHFPPPAFLCRLVIHPGDHHGRSSNCRSVYARVLIAATGTRLAAPRANTSGKPSPTRAAHILRDLGSSGRLPLLLDGGTCTASLESHRQRALRRRCAARVEAWRRDG